MKPDGTGSRLHVVGSARIDPLQELASSLPIQASLFPTSGKRILVFVVFSRVSDTQFIDTLQMLKPHVVVDMRRFPRFDTGKLNRQLAFQCFENAHTKYIDLLWSCQASPPVPRSQPFIHSSRRKSPRPKVRS